MVRKILCLNLKKKLFVLFENLLEKIKIDIIKFLLNLNIVLSSEKKDEQKLSTEEKIIQKKENSKKRVKMPLWIRKKIQALLWFNLIF